MKKGPKTAVAIVVVLVGLFLVFTLCARIFMSFGIRVATGLNVKINRVMLSPFKGAIRLNDITIYNLKEFEEKKMLTVPLLYVDYDLPAILQGKIQFTEMNMNLDSVIVVKNKQGKTNLSTLTAAKKQSTSQSGHKAPKTTATAHFYVKKLHLTLGKVVFKDYSRGSEPTVREFQLGIDKDFYNITDPNQLVALIIMTAMFQTPLANLANLDLGNLDSQFSAGLKDAASFLSVDGVGVQQLGNDTQQVTKKAVDSILKKALDLGK